MQLPPSPTPFRPAPRVLVADDDDSFRCALVSWLTHQGCHCLAVINAAGAIASDRVTRERTLSAAKYSIGRIGTLVAEECIQLHGGIGMTWELPLSHYAKRLVMIDHQLGDEDHHLQRFIALGAALGAPTGASA